jgi:hypothetical protein
VNLLAQEMAYQVLQFDYHTGLVSKWFGGNYAQVRTHTHTKNRLVKDHNHSKKVGPSSTPVFLRIHTTASKCIMRLHPGFTCFSFFSHWF